MSMRMKQLFKVLAAGGALAFGCGEMKPEERIAAAQDGPVAQQTRSRFEEVAQDTTDVGVFLTYEGKLTVPTPSVRKMQNAHHGVVSAKHMEYYHYLPRESKTFLDEIQIYSEGTLTEMGEALDPPPMAVRPEETEQVAAFVASFGSQYSSRRYGEGTGGEGGVGEGINFDIDVAETLSTIIDGIAGAVAGLGQAVDQLHGAMLCMQELGRRVLPGVLQVLDSDDPAVYNCRAECIESSSIASSGWCFYRSGEFIDGGYDEVAMRMGAHLTEMCDQIDADDIERSGICFYDSLSIFDF